MCSYPFLKTSNGINNEAFTNEPYKLSKITISFNADIDSVVNIVFVVLLYVIPLLLRRFHVKLEFKEVIKMKFYLIEISEGDAKIAGKAIYEYETRSEAIANFHTKLGSAMSSELYASEQVIVINSENGIEAEEKYVAEV